MHPSDKGIVTELLLATKLIQAGYRVARPFGDNERYDLIIDDNGSFQRVQCKTGRLRKGVVVFNTRSHSKFTNGGKSRHYRGDIEFFGVYCPDNQKTYLIPVNDVGKEQGMLRVDMPKNGQKKKIIYADKYEIIDPVAQLDRAQDSES